MIADVVFDVPVAHPFSYRVPEGTTVAPGQRVRAPLHGGPRTGLVIAVREGDDSALKTVGALVDRAPVVSAAQLDLGRWIARESLSTLGSTWAALLPPPDGRAASAEGIGVSTAAAGRDSVDAVRARLFSGHGRERRLLDRIAAHESASLVLLPDVDAAARWAGRLAKIGRVVRLDSGAEDAERAEAWRALASGRAQLAVGTRSALLAPLPGDGLLALVDEHEPSHKPPGAPRMHARDLCLERARRTAMSLAMTSATPSVESWWRCDARRMMHEAAPAGPWPAVTVADTRGILRREPLTPPLARAIRESLAAGHRVFIGVSRLTAALACDECGDIVRCETCALALAYTRAAASLTCRLCGVSRPLPDVCPGCQGRRLSPFGWSAERVEHAVRRRFPKASVARYDPDGARGARLEAQRRAAAHAEIVIGTRGALRLFGPATLGAAGFVTPDHLFRMPDFRAGERALGLLWAAAERVRGNGALVVQSQNPEHYAIDALVRQELPRFYREELKFRAELGYPPFRRLAIVTTRGKTAPEVATLADAVVTALRGAAGVTTYPPAEDRRGRARRIVVKGDHSLPGALEAVLADLRGRRAGSRGIMDVEVDPVEWPF